METNNILNKALELKAISLDESVFIYKNANTSELVFYANEIRKKLHPNKIITYIIDRNINITNVCISRCKFCNFHCVPKAKDAYITTIDEYLKKIDELYALGGKQILLQGGLHPELGLKYYTSLFKDLKSHYPNLKLHALGPPEIFHIAKLENTSYQNILTSLVEAGLDSLPGAGAEILSKRVREIVSPGKCSADEWLDIMHIAHKLNILTSSTMMFGHIETSEERIEHLIKLRDVQNNKPKTSVGFISFTPWPFQDENTVLQKKYNVNNNVTINDYIRLIAISRIVLINIENIQASWLTVGTKTGQIALNAGANDFGSVMIEENVVSAAGANYSLNQKGIEKQISEAGYTPRQRNQMYDYVDI